MTRLAQAALDIAFPQAIDRGFMKRLRNHFAQTGTAMAGQARLSALPPDTVHDTGLPPDELAGAPTYDPDLPFFLQAGFGRREG